MFWNHFLQTQLVLSRHGHVTFQFFFGDFFSKADDFVRKSTKCRTYLFQLNNFEVKKCAKFSRVAHKLHPGSSY